MITIIDYGVGNLQSLKKAFARCGADARVSEDAEEVKDASALVLPGVGSFAAGMRGLQRRGLVRSVKEYAKTGRPMLGICLGAQLLLTRGFEFGEHEGLGLIPGRVERFPALQEGEKVPHVGWNTVYQKGSDWSSGIFRSLAKPCDAYFVHSYILVPERADDVLGWTTYGGLEFASAVAHGNIFGVQFHPEKSGNIGLKIIGNFVSLVHSA